MYVCMYVYIYIYIYVLIYIYIYYTPEIKLGDFGIARVLDATKDAVDTYVVYIRIIIIINHYSDYSYYNIDIRRRYYYIRI